MPFLHFKLGARHHYLKLCYNQILVVVVDFKHLFVLLCKTPISYRLNLVEVQKFWIQFFISKFAQFP